MLVKRYSGISIINHWLTVLLVVAMLVLGYAASWAPGDETEDYIIGIHISLGFFVFLFIVWRVFFRLYEGFPSPVGNTPFERKAAYMVHRLLIFLLLLQVFTGPLYLFTEGEGVNVFGWFTVSIPLESLSFIHEAMEEVHIATGLVIIPVLLVLHILGAIRHYWKQDIPSDL